MALLQIHEKSKALGREAALTALVPEKCSCPEMNGEGKRPYRVVYLLHGEGGNCTSWLRKTAIERLMKQEPVIVIMPETANAWWVNTAIHDQYFDHLTEELPQLVRSWFDASDRPEDVLIAGIGSGGYGALHAGLLCPEKFGHTAAFSPVIDLLPEFGKSYPVPLPYIFGPKDELLSSDKNLYNLLALRAAEGNMPQTYISCGEDQACRPQVLQFVKTAERLSLPLTYDLFHTAEDESYAEQAFIRAYRAAWPDGTH